MSAIVTTLWKAKNLPLLEKLPTMDFSSSSWTDNEYYGRTRSAVVRTTFDAVSPRIADKLNFSFHNTTTSNSSTHNNTKPEFSKTDNSHVLRNSLALYGSIWLVVFFLFCCIRLLWKRPYTVRKWSKDIYTPLAENQFGFLSWIRGVFYISDERLMLECGLDAVCLMRMLNMGYRISCVAMLNAAWLIPLYKAAPPPLKGKVIKDRITQLTIANVPTSSKRMIGTVLACYILFGYIMYLIHCEFKWFSKLRYKFLSLPNARNYSIFVRNIPAKLCDNAGVKMFFKSCFTNSETVYEARVRMYTPQLSKWTQERDKTVRQLEHAIAWQEKYSKIPKHRPKWFSEKVESIPTYLQRLRELNEKIDRRINELVEAQATIEDERNTEYDTLGLEEGLEFANRTRGIENDNFQSRFNRCISVTCDKATGTASMTVHRVGARLFHSDGSYYTAGFLTFRSLRSRNAALQVVHTEEPFSLEVLDAPEPDDVFWFNVGRRHKDLEVGSVLSLAATTALCLLWTIPISLIASLSTVGSLRKSSGLINKVLNKAPYLESVLELLAPLLVVLLNTLLPVILRLITMLEGKISWSFMEASLFKKLASFNIIQTLIVSAISGSILDYLNEMINNPASIISFLATSLPKQSTYFIQIVLVYSAISLALESLGVIRISFALIRRCVGPNLTEKERHQPLLFLRPISNPQPFRHAPFTAHMVLLFSILFVYASIAPLSAFFMAACFLYMEAIYRHQFIYIYPKSIDSGGVIWMHFTKILFVCMLIAQFTVAGVMALKKSAIATPLMIPLIVATILFYSYIRQKHYRVLTYLPSHTCLQVDRSRGNDFDLSFLDQAFLQPDLHHKEILPEDFVVENEESMESAQDEESSPVSRRSNVIIRHSSEFSGPKLILENVTSSNDSMSDIHSSDSESLQLNKKDE